MIVNGIIACLNKIPGVSIDSVEYANFADNALDNMMTNVAERNQKLQDMTKDMNDTIRSIDENKAKFSADLSQSTLDIQNKVVELESTRQNRVDNRNNWLNDIQSKINGALDVGNSIGSKFGNNSIPVKAEGGKIDSAGEVEISDEDLQYLKDFAEQDFINKFTSATLAPNVSISFGDVHENVDVEALKGRIETILEEEIAESAEGGYD